MQSRVISLGSVGGRAGTCAPLFAAAAAASRSAALAGSRQQRQASVSHAAEPAGGENPDAGTSSLPRRRSTRGRRTGSSSRSGGDEDGGEERVDPASIPERPWASMVYTDTHSGSLQGPGTLGAGGGDNRRAASAGGGSKLASDINAMVAAIASGEVAGGGSNGGDADDADDPASARSGNNATSSSSSLSPWQRSARLSSGGGGGSGGGGSMASVGATAALLLQAHASVAPPAPPPPLPSSSGRRRAVAPNATTDAAPTTTTTHSRRPEWPAALTLRRPARVDGNAAFHGADGDGADGTSEEPAWPGGEAPSVDDLLAVLRARVPAARGAPLAAADGRPLQHTRPARAQGYAWQAYPCRLKAAWLLERAGGAGAASADPRTRRSVTRLLLAHLRDWRGSWREVGALLDEYDDFFFGALPLLCGALGALRRLLPAGGPRALREPGAQRDALDLIAKLLRMARARADCLQPRDAVALLQTMQHLRVDDARLVAALAQHAQHEAAAYRVGELAAVVASLARMGAQLPGGLLAAVCDASRARLNDLSDPDAAPALVHALAEARAQPPRAWLSALCDATAPALRAGGASARALSQLAGAFGRFSDWQPPGAWLDAFYDATVSSAAALRFAGRDFAAVLWGVWRMDAPPPPPAWAAAMQQAALDSLAPPQQQQQRFSFIEIAATLHACAQAQLPVHAPWLAAAAARARELAPDAVASGALGRTRACLLVWSLGVLAEQLQDGGDVGGGDSGDDGGGVAAGTYDAATAAAAETGAALLALLEPYMDRQHAADLVQLLVGAARLRLTPSASFLEAHGNRCASVASRRRGAHGAAGELSAAALRQLRDAYDALGARPPRELAVAFVSL